MWVLAHRLNGDPVWLNFAQARSMARIVEERPGGNRAKTVVRLSSNEAVEVRETPQDLFTKGSPDRS